MLIGVEEAQPSSPFPPFLPLFFQLRGRYKEVHAAQSQLGAAVRMLQGALSSAQDGKKLVEQHSRDINYLINALESFCAKQIQQRSKHVIAAMQAIEELAEKCGILFSEPVVYPVYKVS